MIVATILHYAQPKGPRLTVGGLFLLLSLACGCAGRDGRSIRLILISPHRDEIREEVELSFRDWFANRSEERRSNLLASIQNQEKHPTLENLAAARGSLETLLADWKPSDISTIADSARSWKGDPSSQQTAALKEALNHWEIPKVEFAWQDVGGTSMIARYVNARFEDSPDGIGIDVAFGGGTDIFLRFASGGLLQKSKLPPGVLEGRIREQLNGIPIYDPDHRWFGPVLSSFGILCNREVLRRINQPEPRAWHDLGKPGLFGYVSSGDPRMTGSIHMVYEIILQGKGWDKGLSLLLRLGANTHTFIRDSGTLTRTVSGGEVAAAGNLDANALSSVGRDPDIMAFNLPDGETIINPDAMGIIKGAPRKELALAFLEYCLSDAGQLIFILQPGQPGGPRRFPLCRLSVVESLYKKYPPSVRSIGAADPFQVTNTIAYNSKLGIQRWDAVNDLLCSIILDAHPDLVAAWRAVLAMPTGESRTQLEKELFAPFVSSDEVLAHAKRIVEQGPRARTLTINEWGETARKRYADIRARASS